MRDKKETLQILVSDIPNTIHDIEEVINQLENIKKKMGLIYKLSEAKKK